MCARAQVQMRPLIRISEMAGRIALKFGVLFENRCQAFYKSLGWRTAAGAHVRTPFSYLGSGWTDALKFGMQLETN